MAAETSNNYPHVVADLGKGWRVIKCAANLQWIVQRKHGAHWEAMSFCQTKEALLRCAPHPHPHLNSLPDQFPVTPVGFKTDLRRGEATGRTPLPKITPQPTPPAPSVAPSSDLDAFERIRNGRQLSRWQPTACAPANDPGWHIPEFLQRPAPNEK